MMPRHSNSETIAEQEPLWTYAVFIASLWVRLPDLQIDRTIELYKNEQEKIGVWHPVSGNLYEPHTFYKILPKPHPILINRTTCLAANVIKIMPSVACRWLSSDQKVWSAWWEIMTPVGQYTQRIMGINSKNITCHRNNYLTKGRGRCNHFF